MTLAIRLSEGPLGSGHPPVSRALSGDVVSTTQNLLSVYDELLADVCGQTERQGNDIAHRAALLRAQLDRRVVDEFQCDVHSFALPSLVAYLGQAVRLYLHGFYDAAILEATSRLSATLRGRLLSLAVWNRLGPHAVSVQKILRNCGGTGDLVMLVSNWRERRHDGFAILPDTELITLAEITGVFASPQQARIVTSLRDLMAKRQAIRERDIDQGQHMTLGAVDSGRRSGGPGAAHTEPLLGYYLTWGSSLHLLLADAVVAVCLILKGNDAQR